MVEMGSYISWMVWFGYIPILQGQGGRCLRVAILSLLHLAAGAAYSYYLCTYPKTLNEGPTDYVFKVHT
jgi:hypothetical protein